MSEMPAQVKRLVVEITENCGKAPTVTVDNALWVVSIANERVRVEVRFGAHYPSRKIQWLDSSLWVDGQLRTNAQTHAEFYRLFHDPDHNGTPQPPAEVADVAELDSEFASDVYAKMLIAVEKARLKDPSTPDPVAGFSAEGLWVVEWRRVDCLIRFEEGQHDRACAIEVWINGENRTGDVSSISAALDLIGKVSQEPLSSSGPSTSASSRPATISNSVLVRRSTVIRN